MEAFRTNGRERKGPPDKLSCRFGTGLLHGRRSGRPINLSRMVCVPDELIERVNLNFGNGLAPRPIPLSKCDNCPAAACRDWLLPHLARAVYPAAMNDNARGSMVGGNERNQTLKSVLKVAFPSRPYQHGGPPSARLRWNPDRARKRNLLQSGLKRETGPGEGFREESI
jgi:hypothetical protein